MSSSLSSQRLLRVQFLFVFCLSAQAFTPSKAYARSVRVGQVTQRKLVTNAAIAEKEKNGSPTLAAAYTVAGSTTVLTWTTCAVVALTRHPFLNLPARHNALTVAQALTFPLPVATAVFLSLRSASLADGLKRLRSATYRRLNLGIVCASLWLTCANGFFAPAFTTGYDVLPKNLKLLSTIVHGATAILGGYVWVKSVDPSPPPLAGHLLPRLTRGFTGSLWSLPSGKGSVDGNIDDPDSPLGRSGASEYALGCALLGGLAVASVVGPFPGSTVPSFLGKRLSRPAAAWGWLGAVVCYCLKDAASRGRLQASTFVTLRKGLACGSGAHLLLSLAKLLGADAGGRAGLRTYYPAALSAPAVSLLSLAAHALLVFAALTPPTPQSSDAAADGAQ